MVQPRTFRWVSACPCLRMCRSASLVTDWQYALKTDRHGNQGLTTDCKHQSGCDQRGHEGTHVTRHERGCMELLTPRPRPRPRPIPTPSRQCLHSEVRDQPAVDYDLFHQLVRRLPALTTSNGHSIGFQALISPCQNVGAGKAMPRDVRWAGMAPRNAGGVVEIKPESRYRTEARSARAAGTVR